MNNGLLGLRPPELSGLFESGGQVVPQGLLGTGLAPFGFRHEESVSAPFSVKGKGFFGLLQHGSGGQATEISAHDDMGRGFPLLVPGLTPEEMAAAHAEMRRAAGLSPFAQPTELRMPWPIK
jgi:hypothetical protein